MTFSLIINLKGLLICLKMAFQHLDINLKNGVFICLKYAFRNLFFYYLFIIEIFSRSITKYKYKHNSISPKNNFKNKDILFEKLNYISTAMRLLKFLNYNLQNTPHLNEHELSHLLAFDWG